MSDAVLSTIIIQVFAIVGFFVKSWLDKRASKKELSNRDKLLTLKVNEIQAGLVQNSMKTDEIKSMLESHIFDNDFQVKFKDEIQKKAAYKLQSFKMLHNGHRKIVNYWIEIIEKFGLKYYYSSYRKSSKPDLKDFLYSEINIKIDNFDTYAKNEMPVPKKLGAKTVYFHQFLQNNQRDGLTNIMPLHNRTLILVERLIQNGLTFETTIELFSNYVSDFIDDYYEKIAQWQVLHDPEYKDID